MQPMPQIEKYMTPNPHTIGKELSIKIALEMMRNHQIRHLPVLEHGKLVGIITDRDIKLASSFKNAWDFRCEDVMSPETYTVTPHTPLDIVVKTMAENKFGSAVVQSEGGKVMGIFTAVDAMVAFEEVLRGHYRARN